MNQTIAVCHLRSPQAPGALVNPSCTERLRSQLPPVACICTHHIQLLSNLQIVICLTAHPLLSGALYSFQMAALPLPDVCPTLSRYVCSEAARNPVSQLSWKQLPFRKVNELTPLASLASEIPKPFPPTAYQIVVFLRVSPQACAGPRPVFTVISPKKKKKQIRM